MKKNIYCSLDLEGTGLDPKKDAIIEAGAVLFTLSPSGELEFLEEFSQLVKPPIPIPEFIQNLTSIHTADVEKAPSWEEVSPKFAKFVGKHVIVGQNIQFDLDFLASGGLEFNQGFIDTKELAGIFLPEARFYNLEYLMRFFNQPLTRHHRALDDSKSAAQLLQQIVLRFHDLPREVSEQVAGLLAESKLLYRALFVLSKLNTRRAKKFTPEVAQKKPSVQADLFGGQPRPTAESGFPPVEWGKIFSQQGTFFADLGLRDFCGEELKNLVRAASKQPGGLVLSVGSEEEFELSKQAASELVSWQILDDPGNYLCDHRLRLLFGHKSRSSELTQFLIKVLVWRSVYSGESLGKLKLFGGEYVFIDLIAGNFEICAAHPPHEACALSSLLPKLRPAGKILTKHSAWIAYAAFQSSAEYHTGIFWDRNALEQTLLKEASAALYLKSLQGLIAALYNPGNGSGILEKVSVALKKNIEKVLNSLDLNFGLWSIILSRELLVVSQRVADLELRETGAFEKIKNSSEELSGELAGLLRALSESARSDMDAGRLIARLNLYNDFLREFFQNPKPEKIYWFDTFNGRLKLKSQVHATPLIRTGNFETRVLCGLVSPQSVKHYYERAFKLDSTESLELSSGRLPLKVRVAAGLPENETPNSQKRLMRLLEGILPKLSARSVVLFNSQKNLEHFYQSMAAKALNGRLLVQKFTGHHWKNLESFGARPDAIWFLTVNNFLKNINSLPPTRNLLLMRIPYEVPGVLAETFAPDEVFETYILPKTALRLQAILSRFLGGRAPADSKQLIVFDPRLALDYNQYLLSAAGQLCEIVQEEFSEDDLRPILED